jgi:hypothetical protein
MGNGYSSTKLMKLQGTLASKVKAVATQVVYYNKQYIPQSPQDDTLGVGGE